MGKRRFPRLLLAVSGGPDSMALGHMALRWAGEHSVSLAVGHVNHGLRGRAADADAAFVHRWAIENDLVFKVVSVDTRAWALRNKRGLEEAARFLRYRALAEMAQALGCRAVATAHTLDDQVETVFMNLERGTGPGGLAGMAPVSAWPVPLPRGVRAPALLRPLLEIRKETLLRCLRAEKVPFRTDDTNAQPLFFRNRVRPVLRAWDRARPGLYERVGRLAGILRDEEAFWNRRLGPSEEAPLELGAFKRYSMAEQRRRLRRSFGLPSFEALERARAFALDPGPTPRVSVPGGWMEKKGGALFFRPLPSKG